MKKTHQSPEFIVIKQTQANAKFFVASGGDAPFANAPTAGTPKDGASHYDDGGDINM